MKHSLSTQPAPRSIATLWWILLFVLLPLGALRAENTFYSGNAPDHILLSPSSENSSVPDVALDWQQNSHLVWRSGRDIYYAKTDKNGNWMLKDGENLVDRRKVVTFPTASFTPSIAVDFDGNAHIAAAAGTSAVLYVKIGADGNEIFRKAIGQEAMSVTTVFLGADIAIDPKTNLPVIGTHATLQTVTLISGIPFQKYQDRIYAMHLDGDANVTTKDFFAASGWTLGGTLGIFSPPSIAVDENGVVHAVWKTRTVNGPGVEANNSNEVIIETAPGFGTLHREEDPNATLAEKYAAKNRHGVSWNAGDIMLEYANSEKVKSIFKTGGVYINTPNDIASGTFTPVPRIAVDWNGLVHIAWNGTDAGKKKAILYSRIKPDTSAGSPLVLGKILHRSVTVNSAKAQVQDGQCDLAVGDHSVHFAWCDKRNSKTGVQIYHGAVTVESAIAQPSEEYAISFPREKHPTWARIAFRPEREFDKWTGYAGDTLNPNTDEFDASEADTLVNLYHGQTITIRATYKNWPNNTPAPSDPEITLEGNDEAPEPQQIHISADDGFGQYSVVWQEDFEGGAGYQICLQRKKYWAEKYGIRPVFNSVNKLWLPSDANAAMGEDNRVSGTLVNLPIPLRPKYAELIRNSNYHIAQGLVADGVTPLIIRVDLPVGNYRLGMDDSSNEANMIPGDILDHRLYHFNHNTGDFEKLSATSAISVRSEYPGLDPRETIFLIKGFDWTDSDFNWPLGNPPPATVSAQLNLWKQVNGEGLDMTTEPPFASISFGVAKPPIILVHGFNGQAAGWSREFKDPLEKHVGSDLVFTIDYGQSMTAAGPWAEWQNYFSQTASDFMAASETLKQLAALGNDAKFEYQVARAEYDKIKSEYDGIKKHLTDMYSVLGDLGIVPPAEEEEEDGGFDVLGTIKNLTYWEKAASAASPLSVLEKEVAMNLYATEELIRHKHQWAFTRYDAIGHCQGGTLLRMLANNSKKNPRSIRFLQNRNFGRGRFRTITTIGTPHRGSRLTQYYRHYYNHVIQEIKDRLASYATLDSVPPLESVGVGLGLMFYADRHGYMEPKFDPCNGETGVQGEVVLLAATHPVHPSARFHYVSTVINHDYTVPKTLFDCAGLIKDAPPSYGLFQLLYPATPKPAGAPDRFTDGILSWRSHLAWLDYTDANNAKYVTHLDELTTQASQKYAAHVPPFSLKAIAGIEEPSAPGWKDVADLIKNTVQQNWKEVLKTIATEMLKKWFVNNDVVFSPYGTLNTQTNMSILSEELVKILSDPVDSHFTQHADYNPNGPEDWGTLVAQDQALKTAIETKVKYLFNERDAQYAHLKQYFSRENTAPGVYHYQLTPPDDLPRDPNEPVRWHVSVMNKLVVNTQGIIVEPDAEDDTLVTITIDQEVYGNVILNCSYFSTTGQLVQISPIVIAQMNMGEITGIHFGAYVPVLEKSDTVFMPLEAEYNDGFYGPLFPEPDVPQSWTSSDETIVTVTNGLVTAGSAAGTATVTAVYGDFSVETEITVVGQPPVITLTSPLAATDLIGGDDVLLGATAEDPDGSIKEVLFFVNDEHLATATPTRGEYTYTWENLMPGTYEIFAVAVDNENEMQLSETVTIEVANRPPTIDAWAAPVAGQWYGGNVFCSASASDPDGDPVTVQFEYSLDSTDGSDGSWAQCYFPLTEAPFDCNWESSPEEALDDTVWLRVWAKDDSGDQSEILTRQIKIDNTSAGMTFSPHPGEEGVALDVHPTITFDNPILKADDSPVANADLPSLISFTQQGNSVSFTATINAEKTVITIVPSSMLDGVTPYTVNLIADIKDGVTGSLFRQTNATFVTTFGTPVAIEFRSKVLTGEAGATLDYPILVNIVDAQSNTITDSTATVTVSLASRAELGGTLSVAAVEGIAAFSNLSINQTGTHTLQAVSTGLGGDTSPALTIRPAALAKLTVTASQDTVMAGERLNTTVSAFDRFDNPKTDYQGTPNFASSDSDANLPPFYTFYETDAGVHTYRNTLVFHSLGSQTLSVRDNGVNSDTISITVTNAPPDAPQLLAPENDGFSGLAPLFSISEFQDTDDAQHAATHLQIADDGEFSNIIWDSGEIAATTSLQLPKDVLAQHTTYHWRARVKDDSGDAATEWSAWSSTASFTTAYSLPFTDPFSENRGWTGLLGGQWEIGTATAGGGSAHGNPDPGTDTTPENDDNGILGYNIGGDYAEVTDAAVTSPPLDCSEADIVELTFQRWLGIEGNDWGHASILVSNDNQEWHEVWANPQTDVADSAWQSVRYDLTPWAANEPTVFLRFSMGPMQAAYPFCGWNIDDLTVGTAAEEMAEIILEIQEENIKVGDYFTLNISLQENSAEANGIMGAFLELNLPHTLCSYSDSYYTRDNVPADIWDLNRSGERYTEIIRNLGGMTTNSGHGDGEPVLLASITFKANHSGTSQFTATAIDGIALTSPVGQIGAWRIKAKNLALNILPAAIEPLAFVTLEGPTAPIALGNSFSVNIYVKETSTEASGFLGGPLDLYFDRDFVSCPNFSPDTSIQPPYTDVGLLSGTLLDNRIDELGGATMETGHGNGTEKLYAIVTFQADAIGQTTLKLEPGSTGLALTTPVGQLDPSRIDYGPAFLLDIRQNYHLTLNGGTFGHGNGNYVEGEVVTITANPPETGMTFDHWEGDTNHLDDANSATTDATMPATDIEVTAVYIPIDYVLTVNGGTGSTPTAHYLDEIGIQAAPPATGKVFAHWEGDINHLDDPNAASATVTMPADNVTVTAVYTNILYTLVVENGTGDTTTAVYQQQISIQADTAPTGYAFAQWTGDTAGINNIYSTSTTITMPAANVTIRATYRAIDYTLTVVNGTGSTSTANYTDVIPISANEPAIGQIFAGWTGDTGVLSDPQSPDTNVTMPARNVTVTATYEAASYTLLVVNGSGSGTYHYGDEVQITANAPAEGEPDFSSWVGNVEHVADTTAATTTVTMPAGHVAVVAVYGAGIQVGDTVNVGLHLGWNCFSVPVATVNPTGKAEYAEQIKGPVYRWDSQLLKYIDTSTSTREAESLLPSVGYWVLSRKEGSLALPVVIEEE